MSMLRNTAFTMCVVAGALLAADNPFVGTWKLNAEKSKLSKSGVGTVATVNVEPDGDGIKVAVDSTDAQGQPMHFTYASAIDGKPAAITGYPAADSTSLKRVDDHTIDGTGSKDGKVVFTDHRTVSANGKTMTIHRTGTNAKGEKYKATLVFDKQ